MDTKTDPRANGAKPLVELKDIRIAFGGVQACWATTAPASRR